MVVPTRVREPELMDAPDLDPAQHARALVGLARLNWLAGSSRAVWPTLHRLVLAAPDAASLTVLDVATGSGDIPATLDARLRRTGIVAHWILADVSSVALEHASNRARAARMQFSTLQQDLLREPLPVCDVAMCTTALHHFDEPDAECILRALGNAARVGGVVLDLSRSRLGPALVGLVARLTTRSPIVHADAVLSMRAAYTRDELHGMATRAKLQGVTVDHVWPVRIRLSWQRPK